MRLEKLAPQAKKERKSGQSGGRGGLRSNGVASVREVPFAESWGSLPERLERRVAADAVDRQVRYFL